MKVRDLIEDLKHYNQDYDVVIQCDVYIDSEYEYVNKHKPIFYTGQDPKDKMVYIGG